MATLKVSETELSDMREFYKEELERTQKRLGHIKSILKQLGDDVQPVQIKATPTRSGTTGTGTGRKRGRPVTKTVNAEKPTTVKARKKPGRKSKWDALIMKRLRQLNKPVTYDELTQEIMTLSKLSEAKRTHTKQAVVSVVFRLRNRDKKLDTFSIGKKEKYIALNPWFDKPGAIKKEYANKINKPQRKTRK